MNIYGWENLNKGTSLLMIKVRPKEFSKLFQIKDKETSEVLPKKVIDQAYCEGRWFLNFNEAKKAMTNDLMLEVQWREEILKKLKTVTVEVFDKQ